MSRWVVTSVIWYDEEDRDVSHGGVWSVGLSLITKTLVPATTVSSLESRSSLESIPKVSALSPGFSAPGIRGNL